MNYWTRDKSPCLESIVFRFPIIIIPRALWKSYVVYYYVHPSKLIIKLIFVFLLDYFICYENCQWKVSELMENMDLSFCNCIKELFLNICDTWYIFNYGTTYTEDDTYLAAENFHKNGNIYSKKRLVLVLMKGRWVRWWFWTWRQNEYGISQRPIYWLTEDMAKSNRDGIMSSKFYRNKLSVDWIVSDN